MDTPWDCEEFIANASAGSFYGEKVIKVSFSFESSDLFMLSPTIKCY